jgi:two-component system, NtrC family, response regulator HupR/HoxA
VRGLGSERVSGTGAVLQLARLGDELHVARQIQRLLERRLGRRAEVRGVEALTAAEAASLEAIAPGARALRTPAAEGALVAMPVRQGGALTGEVRVRAPLGADDRELDFVADLVEVLAEELGLAAAERRVDALIDAPTRYRYDDLIGKSTAMRSLTRLLDKIIDSDSTVLVQGENGTGKELIARAIHYNSSRATHRFVVQNCSAFNDNLLDSELFGHKKGAFTGAIADKQGLFEIADRGTFFLDEIGDMSPALQVKVLRVIQEGTFTAVGDTASRHVDVRLIAATHRDLRRMVDRGEFREDLFYRVNVINLAVPALRERREDIPLLVDHFLVRATRNRRGKRPRLSRACLDRLAAHDWPGNVRELENEIERLVVLAGEARVIGEELLSPRILDRVPSGVDGTSRSLGEARATVERDLIAEVLIRHRWNKTRAAAELGISRRNLIRKVDRYNLQPRSRGPRARGARKQP